MQLSECRLADELKRILPHGLAADSSVSAALAVDPAVDSACAPVMTTLKLLLFLISVPVTCMKEIDLLPALYSAALQRPIKCNFSFFCSRFPFHAFSTSFAFHSLLLSPLSSSFNFQPRHHIAARGGNSRYHLLQLRSGAGSDRRWECVSNGIVHAKVE